MFKIQLVSGEEMLEFIDDPNGNYFLLDDTFRAPPPEPIDILVPAQVGSGERLLKRTFENREVTFSVLVRGDTVGEVLDRVSDIYRLIQYASSDKTIAVGSYNDWVTDSYNLGDYAADSGPILRIQLEDDATLIEDRLTFNVVAGRVNSDNLYSQTGLRATMEGQYVMRQVDIELKCKPYAIGYKRELLTTPDTFDWTTNDYYVIDAVDIAGDAPALTRIVIDNSAGRGGFMIARQSSVGFYSAASSADSTNVLTYSEITPNGTIANVDGTYLEGVLFGIGLFEPQRYKVILSAQDSTSAGAGNTEFRMVVKYGDGHGGDYGEEVYDWVETGYVPNVMVDLGVLDVGHYSRPSVINMEFPDIINIIIDIYARRKDGTLDALSLNYLVCVPVEEEDSWILFTCQDDPGDVYVTNFNYDTPAIFIEPSAGTDLVADSVGEMIGYPVTLTPGVDNILGFYPLSLYSGYDHRKAQLSTASVTVNYIAYRPRYLFVG